MKIVLFDTETTGLPKTRLPATRGPNNWPHMVSIAWIVMEDEIMIKERYAVIKPKWTIPADSIAIHGVTQEIANEKGEEIDKVIKEFLDESPDLMIAHNMNFDFNVLINAILWDVGINYPKVPKQFCTMESMKGVCKLPSQYRGGYKPPKLSELYEFVFNKKPAAGQLHNSLYDTQILKEIVYSSDIIRGIIGLPIAKPAYVENENNSKRTKVLYL